MSRAERHRLHVRTNLVVAARAALAATGEVTASVVNDICEQCGIHPFAFRIMFPLDEDLLDAVNVLLVDECADRLRAGVAAYRAPADQGAAIDAAAAALASAWPLDRGGLVIRARWRLNALAENRGGEPVVAAERRFVRALTSILADLLAKMGRRFVWPPTLAVRVILDTYERSFEAWVLSGGNEVTFPESPYVRRTLPAVLLHTSEPVPEETT